MLSSLRALRSVMSLPSPAAVCHQRAQQLAARAAASEASGGRQRKLKVAHILLEKDKAAQMDELERQLTGPLLTPSGLLPDCGGDARSSATTPHACVHAYVY